MARKRVQRVLITGALGFVGRRLRDHFVEAGAVVSGIDVRADPALNVIAGDLTMPGAWCQAFKGVDLVLHTAARVGMAGSEESYWSINCAGTRHVLDAMVEAGVRRIVHLSSIVAFGFEYPDGVDERYPLRTNGVPYVDTKVTSEQVVLQAHAAGEVDATIIRPGDVYGPGSHFWTVTPVREIAAGRFVLPAMGQGHLSPVYIDDLVSGIALAANHSEAIGQVFTITGGQAVETREFFGHYARMLGKSGVPVAPTLIVQGFAASVGLVMRSEVSSDSIRYLARIGGYSIEKARTVLGYKPAVSLDEGMRRCEDWLREAGFL